MKKVLTVSELIKKNPTKYWKFPKFSRGKTKKVKGKKFSGENYLTSSEIRKAIRVLRTQKEKNKEKFVYVLHCWESGNILADRKEDKIKNELFNFVRKLEKKYRIVLYISAGIFN